MTYNTEWIDNAKAIYTTLLHLECHLAASPEPDPEAMRLVQRLHALLNRLRRLVVPELSFAQFLSVIGETPVESADEPESPQSGGNGSGKDEDSDEVD